MEANNNIERKIEDTLQSVKVIVPVDVPPGFTENTLRRIRSAKSERGIAVYGLLKAAAILLLVLLNVYTISRIIETPLQQPESVKVSMDDLVNDYQVTDVSNDWLNNKTIPNEQP